MTIPTLSIGVPVYNGERYLREALNSLLEQDFRDFEIIVSDNGSTDGTPRICEEYARRDSRVRCVRSEQNQGATWNFGRVVELARGTYFKWAFHDDLCHPTMFRRCIEEFERSDAAVVLVYPRSEFIYERGATRNSESPRWDRVATVARTPHARLSHVIRWLAHGQAIFGVIRLEALRKTRPAGCVAMDWMKVAELAALGKIIELPEVLLQVRIHQGNSMGSNKTWRDLLAWHSPNAAARGLVLPFNLAVMLEYLKSVRYLPLSARERILCQGAICVVWPSRLILVGVQRVTGPGRLWLQARTGWRFLSAAGGGH